MPPRLMLCFLLVLLAGCNGAELTPAAAPPTQGEQPDPELARLLLEAVRGYREFGCVDEVLRVAPALCSMRPSPAPLKMRRSQSTEEASHGKKLYWLFAKDREAYVKRLASAPQPVGQILVKEAWTAVGPEDVHGDAGSSVARSGASAMGRHAHPAPITHLEEEGEILHAGAIQGLFVLLKLDPATPGTDQGWVYGTLTPDGRTVTQVGRMASCMGCHTQAEHDRMFGLREP